MKLKDTPLTNQAWEYRRRNYPGLRDIPQQIAIEKAWRVGFLTAQRRRMGKLP